MATITHGFTPTGDRYAFDFRLCTASRGWAQLDTRQDAPYYGNWLNPITLKLVSYCEGDGTLTECADEAEFVAKVRECVLWHKERDYFLGIDGMCQPEIIAAFQRLGLGEFLH